jgi:hypothetical protein
VPEKQIRREGQVPREHSNKATMTGIEPTSQGKAAVVELQLELLALEKSKAVLRIQLLEASIGICASAESTQRCQLQCRKKVLHLKRRIPLSLGENE